MSNRALLVRALSLTAVTFASACALPQDDQPTTTMTAEEVRTAPNIRVCNNPSDEVQCHARVLTDELGTPRANAAPPPSSFSAAQLRSFYGITGNGSTATTVAIVDAMGYPRALTDLQQYRSMNGLPNIVACSATSGHPCLAVVNQNCATTGLPAFNLGWAQETALDLDMVSAMCPNCNILLVQGSSASFAALGTSVNSAASTTSCTPTGSHPVAISNSYGANEAGTTGSAAAYRHSNVTITASSGDSGLAAGPQFPASVETVLAVGGTSMFPGSTPREKAWSGAGGGCSTLYARPSWQAGVTPSSCTHHDVSDVSAVADPNTGVVVVAPTSTTANGLFVFGGTSVASPLIAGIIGNVGSVISPQKPYLNRGALFDVPPTGYDQSTGIGSPIGTTAF